MNSQKKNLWPLLMALAVFVTVSVAARPVQARPIRVLMVTGDWISQAYYQDVKLPDPKKPETHKLMRGRYVASRVNAAAPGQFEFTDVTNYIGQEYIDADYLSQFDVVLLTDMQGGNLPPSWHEAIQNFVQNGGGLIYCASYKWHTFMPQGTGFNKVLPADFPFNNVTDDWSAKEPKAAEANFKPTVALPSHPVVRGLDWPSVPAFGTGFRVIPKPGADVLLKTPGGAPALVAWTYGKGRALVSPWVFSNGDSHDPSPGFGDWADFGKYYAQAFAWLGANSTSRKTALKETVLKDAMATLDVAIDYTQPLNAVAPGVFSFNSTTAPPNLGGKLTGVALQNFLALNPQKTFARFSPQMFEPSRGQFRWEGLDAQLAAARQLDEEPEIVFDDVLNLPWIWTTPKTSWGNPTDAEVSDCVDYFAAFLQHVNHGKKGSPGYTPVVQYLEVGNEPGLNKNNIEGYVKIFHAVAQRIHRDFPGVHVGALGGYEVPYVHWFIDRAGADVDFIVRHPYGSPGDDLFRQQDEYEAYAKAKGYPQIKFFITEWDYWIAGPPKYDYMVKRLFEAVKRESLIGTLHYRLDQYNEGGYDFGVLWAGYGNGAGPSGTPMNDGYDAYWIFKDFRGWRATVTKADTGANMAGLKPGILSHILADGSRDGDKLNAMLYYDWAYDGTGYKDYRRGINYVKAAVTLHLTFPAAAKARMLTLSTATAERFEKSPEKTIPVPAGQTHLTKIVTLTPLTAVSVTIQ